MRGESSRAMRADAVPNAASTPRHTKNHTLLADPAGRVSCIPTPPHVRSPGRKRPDRARVTAAGRGPSNGNNDIELPSTSISHLLLLFGRGIFWRDGFRPIISCQRPPRPPQGPGRVFRAPTGAFSVFPIARQAAWPRCRIHQIEFGLKRSPRKAAAPLASWTEPAWVPDLNGTLSSSSSRGMPSCLRSG
jgi:hypothetical protein